MGALRCSGCAAQPQQKTTRRAELHLKQAGLQSAIDIDAVQIGPDASRPGIRNDRLVAFFIENLVMRGAAPVATMQ